MKVVRPEDYIVTDWSGGKTIQLAIAPEGAVYADRDFLWRLSSATVDLEESDFTALPDYRRWIAPLDGVMRLTHNGGEEVVLAPYECHAFDGADDTHSWGKCTDFNLMLRKGRCDGEISCIRFADQSTHTLSFATGTETVPAYCVKGSVKAQEGRGCAACAGIPAEAAQDPCVLAPKHSLLLENASGAVLTVEGTPDTVLMLAEIRQA